MGEPRDDEEPDGEENAPRDFDVAASSLVGMAVAAVQVWDPTAGVLAAGVAPFVSALATRWRQRGVRATAVVLEEATTVSGLTADELMEALSDDERMLLAINVIRAATETSYEPVLRMLGRVLAAGADEGARLDSEQMVVRAVTQLQAPQVAVLHVVATGVSGKEPRTEADGTATSQTHIWTLKGVAHEVPSYAEVLEPILALLQREGLLTEVPPQTNDDQAAGVQLIAATSFGREIIRRVIEASDGLSE